MIDKLEYLIVLAAERHFGHAAEKLGITQPTLSAGLRQLEEKLGATLVNRGSRFQGMTAEGDRVLGWARRITDDVKTMQEELATVRTGLSGHLTIGAIPTALAIVSQLTSPFMQRHANVTFEVMSHTSAEIALGVENFEIDVALTYLDDDRLRRLESRPLYGERYCLVTTRGARFADRKNVTWDEVSTIPLGLLSGSMQNRQILNRHLGQGGRSFEAIFESNSMIALLCQTRTAKLATIMPYRSAAVLGFPDPMVAIPIVEPEVSYRIGLVTARRDPRPPILAAFWDESVVSDDML